MTLIIILIVLALLLGTEGGRVLVFGGLIIAFWLGVIALIF